MAVQRRLDAIAATRESGRTPVICLLDQGPPSQVAELGAGRWAGDRSTRCPDAEYATGDVRTQLSRPDDLLLLARPFPREPDAAAKVNGATPSLELMALATSVQLRRATCAVVAMLAKLLLKVEESQVTMHDGELVKQIALSNLHDEFCTVANESAITGLLTPRRLRVVIVRLSFASSSLNEMID